MQIAITGRHIEVPDNLEELLSAKLERLNRYDQKLISLHAIFSKEKYFYTAEFTLAAKGLTLAAKAVSPVDLLTCAEMALAKLKHQLVSREKKRVERRRRVSHRP